MVHPVLLKYSHSKQQSPQFLQRELSKIRRNLFKLLVASNFIILCSINNEHFLSEDYTFNSDIFEDNPDTSNPWKSSEIGSAEFGVEITSLSTTTTTT